MNEDKSKSQIKREAKALQTLGEKLTMLSTSQLDKIPLTGLLYDAVLETKNIQSNLAKKRHIQCLGNLLRNNESLEAIEDAYHKLMRAADLNSYEFKLTEKWRERLLSEDKTALTEFVAQYPCDVQALRLLIRQAGRSSDQAKKSSTALFRFIRDCIL